MASCILIEALFLGIEVQWAVEPDRLDLDALAKTWADLLERFIQSDAEGDVQTLGRAVSQLFDELREEDKLLP